jgi:hypothetical protein
MRHPSPLRRARAPSPSAAALAAVLALAALPGCGELPWDTAGGPSGGGPPGGDPAPDALADEWLAAHAAVRANATPAPSPALSPLGWSSSAAAVAQAWADGCQYRHNPGRGDRGENIAANAPPGGYTATEIVGLWASEAPFYDLASNTCDAADPANEAGTCGHYTQLVWRSTTLVGCARRTCATGSPFGSGSWDYWVCNYDPPGNWVGQRPY